jgi:hypothetical protein
MKSPFLRSVILVGVLLIVLSGCQFLDEAGEQYSDSLEDEQQEEFAIETKTGVLSVNNDESAKATHIFTTGDGEEFPTRSGNINLRKYEERDVELEGKMASDGVFEVEHAVKLGREDDAREIYRHTQLGFSVLAVSTWTITEQGDSVTFTPYPASESESVDRILVSRLSNERNLGAAGWLDLNSDLSTKDAADDGSYTNVVIGPDALAGIKRVSLDEMRNDFYVQRDDAMYRLTHKSIGDEDHTKYRNVFLEMVNGFQFVSFANAPSSTEPEPEPEVVPESNSEPESEPTGPSNEPSEASSLPPGDLTQTLSSNGLGITMSFPKNWYWAQKSGEIHLSDGPLDEDGNLTMKLGKGVIAKNAEISGCTTVAGDEFCASVQDAEHEGLMNQMLATIAPITQE